MSATRRIASAFANALEHAVSLLLLCTLAVPAVAAPPGRAWTPIGRFVHSDHEWMKPDRFEPTAGGKLELLLTGIGGQSAGRTYGFAWRDTTWVPRWHLDAGAQHVPPCLNDSGVQMLVYATSSGSGSAPQPFYMALVEGDSVTTPDSIDTKYNANILTVGTRSSRFLWAAGVDLEGSTGTAFLKLYAKPLSAAPGTPWTKLRTPREAVGRTGVYMTMSAASESTCIMIWSAGGNAFPGLLWGVVNDTGWVRAPERIDYLLSPDRPSTRRDGRGGHQVFYGNIDSVSFIRTLRGEKWSDLTEIHWTFPLDQSIHYYFMYNADMSYDTRPLPVLTAVSYNSTNGSTVAHVSVPDSGRYGRGEWIRGSERAGLPWVARDENGDVWMAWSRFYDGAFWLHSYVSATCTTPVLQGSAGHPRLRWTLSDRTPESAWMVLRSVDGGPFEPLERVIAGDDVNLTYLDRAAPAGGRLRYRLRRESRDTRYRWESAVSQEWVPPLRSPGLRLSSSNPVVGTLEAELIGAAAGEIELRLLDLQGRTVMVRTQVATGTGRDPLRMDMAAAGRIRPGVYLLRARSGPGTGTASASVKVAILR